MKRIAAVTTVILALVPAAFAQKGSEINTTISGSGRLVVNNRSENVSRVKVSLRNNARAEITIYGGRTEVLTGSWYQTRGGEVDVEISNGFGTNDTSGTGRLVLTSDRRSFSEIDLGGRTRGARWSFDFETGRNPGGGWTQGDFDMNSSQAGRGTLNWRGRADLREVSVRLMRNGDFQIDLRGNRTETIRGTWSESSRNRVTLRIDEGFNSRLVKGEGSLTLSSNRRSFQNLQISGNVGRERFDANFTSSGGVGGGGNPGFAGMNVSAAGSGTLVIGGRGSSTISGIRVRLERNGEARIEVDAQSNVTLIGHWRLTNATTIEVVIEDGFGREGARGTGRIILIRNNTSFSRVDISGTTAGRNFSVGFLAR